MRLILIPFAIICLLLLSLFMWKSKWVDKTINNFLDSLTPPKTPHSADALIQERERLKKTGEKLKETIVEKRENLKADVEKLSQE